MPVVRIGNYTLAAQALHWITAALMFTLLPLAWVMVSMPRTAANRELIYTLHKSLGLTVLALVAARLIWRAIHPAPPLPGSLGHPAARIGSGGQVCSKFLPSRSLTSTFLNEFNLSYAGCSKKRAKYIPSGQRSPRAKLGIKYLSP